MELRILHEESHFLIIDKPAGLFSQAAAGIASVQTVLAEQIKLRDQHAGIPFIGLPHRLDRGTSGVMLIARNQRALKRFGEQFQSRKIGKYYLAVVAGPFSGEGEEWSDYVRKIPDQPLAEICSADDTDAKLAQLTARSLHAASDQSLLLVKLHTGRMHQIRIQAASRKLPILGDIAYGGPSCLTLADQEAAADHSSDTRHDSGISSPTVALHALRIELRHPQTAKQLAFTAPPPATWQQFTTPAMQSSLDAIVGQSIHDRAASW